jgi:TP901 family phage tail tape measure protein
MASRVGALFVGLGLDDTQYRAGMAAATGTAQKSTARMQMNFSTLNFRTFLYGMAGIYAVKAAIEGIMSPVINFESQMASVSTVLDKTAMKMLPKFNEEIKTMAKETGQGTKALSDGLRDIIGSVIKPTEAMGLLKIANESAIGGMTDTATTTSALVTILKSYGMETSKAAHVSDVLFATVLRGRITFEELASGIGVVASSAAQAGLKFEEAGAMISVMTRAGLSPDMTMIALANMLNKFVTSSDEAKKMAHSLGFELNTTTLKTGGMKRVMESLTRATAEQIAVMFPEMRGLRGINAALSDSAGFMQDLEMNARATGMRMEAFGKQFSTTREVLKRLSQTLLIDIIQPITGALLPAVIDAANKIKEWTSANDGFIKTKMPEYIRSMTEAAKNFIAAVELSKVPLTILYESLKLIATVAIIAYMVPALTKLIALFALLTPAVTGLAFVMNLALGTAFVGSLIVIYDTLTKVAAKVRENKEAFGDWTIAAESLTTNLESRFKNGKFFFATDVAITKGYKERRAALDAIVKTEAEQKKPLEQVYGILDGINTLSEYGLTLDATKLRMLRVYNKFLKDQTPAKGIFDYGFTDEQIKAGDKALKAQVTLGEFYANKRKDQTERDIAHADIVKNANNEVLNITRDTEMMRLEYTKTGVELQIAQEGLRLKAFLEAKKAELNDEVLYNNLKIAAEQQYQDIVALIQLNAQKEAAERSAQEWEAFKDHFSSILARMVTEGELSAKAIGQAFADAFRRIAIERVAGEAVDKAFDWAKTLPIVGGVLGFLAGGPAGAAVGSSIGGGVGDFVGSGGMAKPAFAPVSGANNTNNNDNSNVNIHIHADSETLRGLNPWKFAELYKEAKRSQLLAG